MVKNRRKPSGHTEIKRGGNVGSDTCSDVLGKYIIDVRDRSGPCLAGRFGFGNLDAKLVSPASQLVVSPAQTRFCRRLRWRLVLELHDIRADVPSPINAPDEPRLPNRRNTSTPVPDGGLGVLRRPSPSWPSPFRLDR